MPPKIFCQTCLRRQFADVRTALSQGKPRIVISKELNIDIRIVRRCQIYLSELKLEALRPIRQFRLIRYEFEEFARHINRNRCSTSDSLSALCIRARAGNQEAWTVLWKHCKQTVVRKLFNKYNHPRNDRAQMLSDCQLGFYRAVQDWDPAQSSFLSYCWLWVKSFVLKTIRNDGKPKRSAFASALSLDMPLRETEATLYDLNLGQPDDFTIKLSDDDAVERIVASWKPHFRPREQLVLQHLAQETSVPRIERAEELGMSKRELGTSLQIIRTKKKKLWTAYEQLQLQ